MCIKLHHSILNSNGFSEGSGLLITEVDFTKDVHLWTFVGFGEKSGILRVWFRGASLHMLIKKIQKTYFSLN